MNLVLVFTKWAPTEFLNNTKDLFFQKVFQEEHKEKSRMLDDCPHNHLFNSSVIA